MIVTVTENVKTVVSGKNGKTYEFHEVWGHLPGAPYPQKFSAFGRLSLAPGNYEVPVKLGVVNERLAVDLDFDAAKAVSK